MDKNTEKLRQQCLRIMCQKSIINKGAHAMLADKTGHNKNSICMALTGYRTGPVYKQILRDVKSALKTLEAA